MAEAQERCTSREFAEWMAYYELEPWGLERTDAAIAQLCALFANAFGRKNSQAAKPADFMIDYLREPKAPQTAENMKTTLRSWVKSVGGKVS